MFLSLSHGLENNYLKNIHKKSQKDEKIFGNIKK